MTGLRITTKKALNGTLTIILQGFIDAYTYDYLEQTLNRLIKNHRGKFMVDLSAVDYMSVRGAMFFNTLRLNRKNNGNIILVNPKPIVQELFNLLGLTKFSRITNRINHHQGLYHRPKPKKVINCLKPNEISQWRLLLNNLSITGGY